MFYLPQKICKHWYFYHVYLDYNLHGVHIGTIKPFLWNRSQNLPENKTNFCIPDSILQKDW